MNDLQQTTLTVEGEIDGHDVTIEVEGPEAQVLPDDADRIGADVLTMRLKDKLGDVKAAVEGGDGDE